MALLKLKVFFQFSNAMPHFMWDWGKLNIRISRKQKAVKCYINSSFKICTAYRIVLVGGIKGNEMGGPCSTYSGYRNKDVV
jgi:hypothetical protein